MSLTLLFVYLAASSTNLLIAMACGCVSGMAWPTLPVTVAQAPLLAMTPIAAAQDDVFENCLLHDHFSLI